MDTKRRYAEKDTTDYKMEMIRVSASDKMKLSLANGGGFAIKFSPVKQ